MVIALAFPNWSKNSKDSTVHAEQNALALTITATTGNPPVVETKGRLYIAAALVLVAGLAAWSVSQYKNRLLQMKIGFGISLSIASCLVAMMIGSKEGEQLLEPSVLGTYEIGFYAPFIALFSNIITNRLIRKDERLVRSMDRIR